MEELSASIDSSSTTANMSPQTLKHSTPTVPSKGYETRDDNVLSSNSSSTSSGSQSFDTAPDRRRIHELYAAQYRQDAENGSLLLGYLPLLAGPHQNSTIEASETLWECQINQQSNSAPSQEHGLLHYTPRPPSASCTISSLDTVSQIQDISHKSSPQSRTEFESSETMLRGSMLFGGLEPQRSFTVDEQGHRRFPNLESPWTIRQPGMPAAGSSASGNVSTRFASTRVSGNQQVAAGTASNVAPSGNNGLMVANTESFFTHGAPLDHGTNDSLRLTSSSEESVFKSNMLGSSLSEYYQIPSTTVIQQRNSTSCSAPRYPTDPDVGRHSLQFEQFTPAPTPFQQPTSFVNETTEDSGSDSNLSRTSSRFMPNNGIKTTAQQKTMTDCGSNSNPSARLDPTNNFMGGRILDSSSVGNLGDALRTPCLPYSPSAGPSLSGDYGISTMNTSFSSVANLDDSFYDRYLNPRRNLQDAPLNLDLYEESWPSFKSNESRKLDNAKVPDKMSILGRNERWNDKTENPTGHAQGKIAISSSAHGLNGIDHYQGSPQQTSRGRPLTSSRSQLFQGTYGGHCPQGYYPQAYRSGYPPSTQRCSSCYAVKLELEQTKLHLEKTRQRLDQTKQQLTQCARERDRCFRLYLEMQANCQESEVQIQRVQDRLQYQASSKRTPGPPEFTDTATRLQRFYQRHLQQIESEYQRGSPEAGNPKDDQYFQSEFAMLFTSSVRSWADRYFKFPHQEPLPRQLDQTLKELFQRDDYVESLITNEKTKSFVVQGLVSRLIVWKIFNAEFRKSLQSLDDKVAEEEAGKKCSKICKQIHDLITTLLSRFHDRSVVEASERSLQNIFEHAGRLSLAMARAGGDKSWFIDFPQTHEQYKAELMHDAEQYHKNIDSKSLERERAPVKLAAMPLVVRVQQRHQYSVIFKAQVILTPFSY